LPIDDKDVFPSGKHPKRTLRKSATRKEMKNDMNKNGRRS
jgi:hypothetical protein